MRTASQSRTVEQNITTGETILWIEDDFGAALDLDTALVSGEIARETYRIVPDDPLSASVDIHWTETLERKGENPCANWSVRTETWSSQRADATCFHLTARIEAYEGEKLVFEKDFAESIPRDLV